jgi:hypothetical protein
MHIFRVFLHTVRNSKITDGRILLWDRNFINFKENLNVTHKASHELSHFSYYSQSVKLLYVTRLYATGLVNALKTECIIYWELYNISKHATYDSWFPLQVKIRMAVSETSIIIAVTHSWTKKLSNVLTHVAGLSITHMMLLRGLSPRANYTDRATAACQRS